MPRVSYRGPWRVVIAATFRQAELFVRESCRRHPEEDWAMYSVIVVTPDRPERMRGLDLSTYEVWWLDRMWPCRTREDVEMMEMMKRMALARGARLRRWWT